MRLTLQRRNARHVSSTATRIYQCLEWVLILAIVFRKSGGRDIAERIRGSLADSELWHPLQILQSVVRGSGAWQVLLLLAVLVVATTYEGRSHWLSLLLYVVIFPQIISSVKCPSHAALPSDTSECLATNVQISAVSFLFVFIPYFSVLGQWTPDSDQILQLLGYALPSTNMYLSTLHVHVLRLDRALVGTSLSVSELSLLAHAFTALTYHYMESIMQDHDVPMPTTFLVTFLYGLLLAIYPAIPILKSNIRLAKVKPQHRWKNLHKQQYKYAVYVYVIIAAIILSVVRWYLQKRLRQDPFLFVLEYISSSTTRMFLIVYWAAVAASGIFIVIYFWGSKPVGGISGFGQNARRLIRHSTENDLHKASAKHDVFFEEEGTLAKRARALDRRRKFFHGLVVVLFLPTINVEPDLSYLALSVVFTAFIFEEVLRVTVLPPFGVAIHKFLSGFTDHRDKTGHLVVSHFFLLLGVAGPVWLTMTGRRHNAENPQVNQSIAMLSGVLTLGAGDAAASIVGKKFGRHKWPSSKKSFEGTFAFVLAMLSGGYVTTIFSKTQDLHWGIFVTGVLLTGFMEAASTENDNLIIPIYMWCLVS